MPNCRISQFIQDSGEGKYTCFRTKKFSLDTTVSDELSYDDKKTSHARKSDFAETDDRRIHTIRISDKLIKKTRPIFSFFLDGSRHVYKIADIAIGKKIFPFLAGQIIVGCCERKNRDSFRKYALSHKLVLALPVDFNTDDDPNFCNYYLSQLNQHISGIKFVKDRGIKFSNLLLYKTDGGDSSESDKDKFKNRAVAVIQSEMTDEEQRLVAKLCADNLLDDENYLLKDGSIEYNPRFSNMSDSEWNLMRANYQHVVGVSKSFDPELLPNFEGNRLSITICNLKPFERTKVYRYKSEHSGREFAVWYLRIRNSNFRETNFSDVVKCEMVISNDGDFISTDIIDTISANIIREAYPVCFGQDSRWANHLYPVFLTETFCKSNYINNDIFINLF